MPPLGESTPSGQFDSRRSLKGSVGFPSVDSAGGESLTSPSGSLATSQSRNSSLGHIFDSRRSLQPSNSFGENATVSSISEHGTLNGTRGSVKSLAGKSL